MATFVSMLNWCGEPPLAQADIQRQADVRGDGLRAAGMHSLVFLPDEGTCAAIMISAAEDAASADSLARAIVPRAYVRVESMRFDDDPAPPAWLMLGDEADLPDAGLVALYEEVAAA